MGLIHQIQDVLTIEELDLFAKHISNISKDEFQNFRSMIDYESIKNRVKTLIEAQFATKVSDYDYFGTEYDTFGVGEKQQVHIDFTKRDDKPDFSSIVYWVNDFDGGEIYFPEEEIEIKPKAGSLIYWANPTFHGVKKITKGNRYATSFFWIKN
jgi:predicted 2-oxoglutarate/Fe(II)-dependent dioxygenase YbiX